MIPSHKGSQWYCKCQHTKWSNEDRRLTAQGRQEANIDHGMVALSSRNGEPDSECNEEMWPNKSPLQW